MKSSSKPARRGQARGDYLALALTALALLLSLLCSQFVFMLCRTVGDSMVPTLHAGEWIGVSRFAYRTAYPQRGDIIVFDKPDVTSETLVKRVIGTPLDTVEIISGVVFVNGLALPTGMSGADSGEDMGLITVPPGVYFVMGDNRAESNDSRRWDEPFVSFEQIIGKAVQVLYPNIRQIN